MTGPLPEPPELEPTALSGSSFGRARRGFEPTEVNSMLGRAADALRVWAERDAKMTERIADLSKRLDAAEEFDEGRVTELLGAETARIVAAARDAASEMRSQALAESTELLDRSRAEAEATSQELVAAASSDRAEATRLRSDAEKAASEMISEATAQAERTLGDAREEADRVRESAREEAERVRAAASEDAAKLTSEAQTRHDEMIESAGKVLDERTGAAEAAASEIRVTASEELEAARVTASEELERARTNAREISEKADADAEASRSEARDQGRAMLDEARELRRQMLRDIAERTRAGRQKVEAAKAARAEVLRAIRVAGGELDRALTDLSDHDHAMRKAADSAAGSVPYDVDLTMKQLEDRLDAPLMGSATSRGDRADAGGSTSVGVPSDDTAPGETQPTDTRPAVTDSADTESVDPDAGGTESVDPDSADTESVDPDSADTESADTESVAADPDGTEPDDSEDPHPDTGPDAPGVAGGDADTQMASVHDLFERLRSEEPPSPEQVQPDERETGVANGAGATDRVRAPGAPTGSLETGREPSGGDLAVVAAGGLATLPEAPAGDIGDLGDPVMHDAGDPRAVEEVDGAVATDVEEDRVEAASLGQSDGGSRQRTGEADEGLGSLLDRRDELLEPAEKLLGRTLKRLLSDEQNEVLDLARRNKRSRVEVSDLLGESESTDHFSSKLTEAYLLAAGAGARMWADLSGDTAAEPAEDDVVPALEAQIEELLGLRRAQLREVLQTHSEAGGDPGELVDRLRSAYRDLRATWLEDLAGDLATGGFAAGTAVGAGPGASWRWVPDNGGLPCADAEDNALEGPVRCGSQFPTGDHQPPAHPGCRCIVVPASVELR